MITDPNIGFEENSSHQEGIIKETYESPDKSYIREPHELADLVDTSKMVQKFPPKQTDIDKILDIIKRKVLKGMHLPLPIKEIQSGYLTSPYFKDLYIYLAQNKLPNKRSAILKMGNLGRKIHSVRFPIIQVSDHTRQRNSTVGHMCRQNNNVIPYQFICRRPGCNKEFPNH